MGLKIIFMGTPDFSVPALEKLIHSEHDVVAVYSQPPRPKGRGKKVQPSPVHECAAKNNIPVETPLKLKNNQEAQQKFAAYDADVAVVVAYGLILPKEILETPRYGCLNIHASLLPRWRGAAPIQYAIWSGDTETGIAIMQMDEGLDTGDVITHKKIAIRPQTTAQSLHDELSALGAAMIHQTVDRLVTEGPLESVPQTELEKEYGPPTYAHKVTKDNGRIDWSQSAAKIDCQIRALNPWPGVWTTTPDNKRIKVLDAELLRETFVAAPGTITDHNGHISCGKDTSLKLITVQPENAKKMDVISAINGGYLHKDMMLG